MFPVDIPIADEGALVRTMEAMRTWLDHQRLEPAAFRYRYEAGSILFRVEFASEAHAAAFAAAFAGKVGV